MWRAVAWWNIDRRCTGRMLRLAVGLVYKESVRQVYEELRLLMRGQFGFETVTVKLLTSGVVLSW